MGAGLGGARGRVAVITGGASGLGLAAARKCAALGMKVVLADVNEAGLAKAKAELEAGGAAAVVAVVNDVTSPQSTAALRDTVYGNPALGEVAFLFLNAGFSTGTSVLKTPVEKWRSQMEVNVYGVLHGIQAFVPKMIAQGTEAHVAATSSFAGLINASSLGVGAGTAYTVSKHAVTIMMEGLEDELRTKKGCKVKAHSLHPAGISTNYFSRASKEAGHDGLSAAMEKMQQTMQTPADAAQALQDGVEGGQFYILAPDRGLPREQMQAQIRTRADDMILGRPPLSHQLRGHPLGTEVRAIIKKAGKEGLARQKATGKL